MRVAITLCVVSLSVIAVPVLRSQPPAPVVTGIPLSAAEPAMELLLKSDPKNDQARLALGMVQALRGIERFGQSLHRHGFQDKYSRMLGIRALPIPPNSKPEPITCDGLRDIVKRVADDMAKADATLAEIKSDGVKFAVDLAHVHVDFSGSGQPTPIFAIFREFGLQSPSDENFIVSFDRGDASWLRGYCHLVMAGCDFVLAHDERGLFDAAAHSFFANATTPNAILAKQNPDEWSTGSILDAIAFIHTMRFPVIDAARLKSCHGHLLAACRHSKEMWKHILAETDDDNEWIPNPKQKPRLNFRVEQEMVNSWLTGIGEIEDILEGRRLLPYWRDAGGKGVNLKRALLESRQFDLVLWVQGTAAVPFLEEGKCTRQEVWTSLQSVFRGDLFWFAVWVN